MELDPKLISILHIFVFGPLVIYAAYNSLQGQFIPPWVWNLFYVIGAIAIAYHSFKLYNSKQMMWGYPEEQNNNNEEINNLEESG